MTNEHILKIALAEKAVVEAALGWYDAPVPHMAGLDDAAVQQTKALIRAVHRLLEVKESA